MDPGGAGQPLSQFGMSRLVPPTAPAPSSSPKEDWDASDSEEEEQATAWEEADPTVLGRLIEEDPEPADQGVPDAIPA